MVIKKNLENLAKLKPPSLHAADPNWETLKGLVERAAQALADAEKKANSLATRFSAGYGAAFWLARVALEASGYRLAGSQGHRATVFQCLEATVEWKPERWRRLDDLHRFRNRFDYGDIVDVAEDQVETIIADAKRLFADVIDAFPNANPAMPMRGRGK